MSKINTVEKITYKFLKEEYGFVTEKHETFVKEITEAIRAEERGIWAYHGTNKENALKIIKGGFLPNTHFAHQLSESLEFGGSWVFRIKWKDKPPNWQFLNKEHMSPEQIDRLTQYSPIVRIGTQPHLTRKVDSKEESQNLTGVPLTPLPESKSK